MTTTATILDVTTQNFSRDVVERSRTTPVLVDLWATWCAPCKTLGPTLEKLATESKGAFVLAKVDIDQNPEVAEAFGVQSVPTVMLLKNGQIVDGFVGAQPEAKIREILARHVGPPPADPLEEALAIEHAGNAADALERVAKLARATPPSSLARAHLARMLLVAGRTDEGRAAYEALAEGEKELEPARAAKALLALQENRVDLAPLEAAVKAKPDDVAARIALGRGLLAASRNEAGLDQLMEAAKLDLRFNDSEPRKALVEAFGALDSSEPKLVAEARRRLSVLLCS